MNRLELLILHYFHYLEAKGRTYNLVIGLLWVAVIGAFDILVPGEVKHSFFYLLPIAFVTWFSGLSPGIAVMLLCAGLWSVNNIVTSPLITCWNVVSTFLFFSAMVAWLHKTRTMWENDKNLSRTDPLTGAMNLRAFTDLVKHEMLRSQREGTPFSLAYLDLDNFKQVNDTYGHAAGDALLSTIVTGIVSQLRKTDILARLGGDEFAIFFPAADWPSVEAIMQRVTRELAARMQTGTGQVSCSIGVLTSAGGLHDFDRMLSHADALMYTAKRAGKNCIRYGEYPPNNPPV